MNELVEIFQNKYERIDRHNPHHHSRPNGINGIVIHSMGQFIKGYGYAGNYLEEIGLSAHYLINPDGSVTKCVGPARKAFHAGKSKFKNIEDLNQSFVGIEVLVEGTHDYVSFLKAIKNDVFTNAQYDSTAVQCALLCYKYNIPTSHIVRHSEVSGPEVRDDPKKDPGSGFRWGDFNYLTNEFLRQLHAADGMEDSSQ